MHNSIQKGFAWLSLSMICSLVILLSACGNLPASTGSTQTPPTPVAKGNVTVTAQVKSNVTSSKVGSLKSGSKVSSAKISNIVSSGSTVSLTTVRMVNRWVGWAVANKTTVLRTIDGGEHWTIVTPLYSNASAISSFVPTFTDGLHAWIAYQAGMYQEPVTIVRTSDGGLTWESTTISPANTSEIVALQFRGPIGWLMVGGDPGAGHEGFTFYKTLNGGQSWSELSTLYTSDQVSGISFLDTETGFLAFGGPYSTPQLAVTHNGGLSWTNLSLPAITHLPASEVGEYLTTPPVLFGSHGYLPVYVSTTTGLHGFVLYQTYNSGQSWLAGDYQTLSPANQLSSTLTSDFYIVDQQHGYETDSQGSTWLTALDGTYWRKLTGVVGPDVASLSFTDSQHGWAAGDGLWRTTDGGNSWQAVNYIVQ